MQKRADDDLERRRLDTELDKELEATFPASDALKLTRRSRNPDTLAPQKKTER